MLGSLLFSSITGSSGSSTARAFTHGRACVRQYDDRNRALGRLTEAPPVLAANLVVKMAGQRCVVHQLTPRRAAKCNDMDFAQPFIVCQTTQRPSQKSLRARSLATLRAAAANACSIILKLACNIATCSTETAPLTCAHRILGGPWHALQARLQRRQLPLQLPHMLAHQQHGSVPHQSRLMRTLVTLCWRDP